MKTFHKSPGSPALNNTSSGRSVDKRREIAWESPASLPHVWVEEAEGQSTSDDPVLTSGHAFNWQRPAKKPSAGSELYCTLLRLWEDWSVGKRERDRGGLHFPGAVDHWFVCMWMSCVLLYDPSFPLFGQTLFPLTISLICLQHTCATVRNLGRSFLQRLESRAAKWKWFRLLCNTQTEYIRVYLHVISYF